MLPFESQNYLRLYSVPLVIIQHPPPSLSYHPFDYLVIYYLRPLASTKSKDKHVVRQHLKSIAEHSLSLFILTSMMYSVIALIYDFPLLCDYRCPYSCRIHHPGHTDSTSLSHSHLYLTQNKLSYCLRQAEEWKIVVQFVSM